jgi:hypothetical protein
MKPLIALSALLVTGFETASSETASAVVYCQYIDYPASCVARPGVALRARPLARGAAIARGAAVGVGVHHGVNRGGPVNRVGRR